MGLSLLFILLSLSTFASTNKHSAFKANEKLEYNVSYGVIKGGVAVLEVGHTYYKGKSAHHLYLNARTVGLLDKLYSVDDTYQCFTNELTDLPYGAIRDIKEGRYTNYTTQEFDHTTRTDSTIVFSSAVGEVLAPKDCNDILSAFYYLRNHQFHKNLKPGDTLVVETYFTDELYSLKARFMGYETIKTSFGKVECMKFIPVVITGRVFKNEDDMIVWFSNDKNFLPVRVRFNLFLGAIYCDLNQYSGLLHPFSAIKSK